MALCTVAGIGGGGVANSMLIAFFKFDTKPAVAISSFSILVCTTFRFFYNFNTRNPEKPQMNVLDYGLASIMISTTLAGSQIGGYILLIFPSIFIQGFLTLLLAYLTYLTTTKGIELHKKEKAAEAQISEDEQNPDNRGIGNDTLEMSQKEDAEPLFGYGLQGIESVDEVDRNSVISQDPNDPKKLQFHHNTFILGESWDHAKEILEVADIAKRESG